MLKNSSKVATLALITGASSGIGSELAKLLAKIGIPLILVARNEQQLENLAKELKKFVKVSIVVADLCTKDGCSKVIDIIHKESPDLVVNNAGFGLYGEAISHLSEESLKIIDLNVKALTEITIEACKTLIAKERLGRILNISSASDLIIFPGFAVYAATKAFVTQFSMSLDVEVKPKGVRVLTAAPGVVNTKFRERASNRDDIPSGKFSMDASFAANQLLKQIKKNQSFNTFDLKTRIMRFLARFLIPSTILSKILYKIILSYNSERKFKKSS